MASAYVLRPIFGNVDSWPLKPKPGLSEQACLTGWKKPMPAQKDLRHHACRIRLTMFVMAEQALDAISGTRFGVIQCRFIPADSIWFHSLLKPEP